MSDTRDPQAVIAAAEQAALAGDYAAAERLLREAAQLQEASLGPLHPELANTLNNLGVVYEVTEKPDEAERCFRRASAIAAAVLAPDHPFVATSRKNLEDFCAARGIPVDAPAPVKPTEAPAVEPPAIESRAIDPTPAAVAPPPVVVPPELSQKPALPKKRDHEPPAVATRTSRSLLVPGLVVAALIVAALIGRMWFGPSEAPPPAAEPTASASPAAAPEPATAKTPPPVSVRKEAAPAKPQPAKPQPSKPARTAEAPPAKGAPLVVSVQLCGDLGTSGAGEWRCTPPRNPATPGRMYFYTRLKSERETRVQHRWYQGEQLRQSVELTVHANPGAGYRTYSRNTVAAGEWRVELRTRDGALLREEHFTVR